MTHHNMTMMDDGDVKMTMMDSNPSGPLWPWWMTTNKGRLQTTNKWQTNTTDDEQSTTPQNDIVLVMEVDMHTK